MSETIYRRPPGTQDLFPEELARWERVETTARRLFTTYGYREIRTPQLEFLSLFQRSIGETTDIVEKEMYVFSKGDETLVLRPEGTAGVVRACIEGSLFAKKSFQKLCYIGPMFRYERPQAGRLRQFHQLGVEALGSYDPLLDAETIKLACHLFDDLGIAGYHVGVNSIGCRECRPLYRSLVLGMLEQKKDSLCDDCRRRLGRNPLRVFDCKVEGCKQIARTLPIVYDHLCRNCRSRLDSVRTGLEKLETPYEMVPYLFRGFDYYTGLVYEITHSSLGAQNTICGGGRYDHLVAECGGPDVGAVGFAAGIERILLLLPHRPDAHGCRPVFIVSIGETHAECFRLAGILRTNGIACEIDYEGRSTKAQMREANKSGSPFTIIVGEDEVKQSKYTLKNMASHSQQLLDLPSLISMLKAGPTH